MSEKQRQCRFFFENEDLALFNLYSRSSCLFECQLKYASARCQCVPWNYPRLTEDISICHYISQNCFEKALDDSNILTNCSNNCPNDCTTTQYHFSVSSTPFHAKKICNVNHKDQNSLEYALKKYLGENADTMPPKFIRRFEQLAFDKEIGDEVICRRNMKNVAIVKFQLMSPLITRIKKTQRVSFTDLVSNFGKYAQFFCTL